MRYLEEANSATIRGYPSQAAVGIRSNIAKARAVLAQILQNPSRYHNQIADQIISYLYGTKDPALKLDPDEPAMGMYVGALFADNEDRTVARNATNT